MNETEPTTDADTFAAENLLHYCGDVDAANHGGTFYNVNRDHHANGYIEALRITPSDEIPAIWVESLTVLIHPPESSRWFEAAECCGFNSDTRTRLSRILDRVRWKLSPWYGWRRNLPERVRNFLAKLSKWFADKSKAIEHKGCIQKRAELSERERIILDAEFGTSYGHYDPANCFPEHHTSAVRVPSDPYGGPDGEPPESADFEAIATDDDGDEVFDEVGFWGHVQTRADSTFTDLSNYSGDNLMAEVYKAKGADR